jgi:hypothetical protein
MVQTSGLTCQTIATGPKTKEKGRGLVLVRMVVVNWAVVEDKEEAGIIPQRTRTVG